MELKKYYLSLPMDERQEFVTRAKTTINYMPLLTGGHRKASPSMSRRIMAASNGQVTLSELRPDIWPPGETV